MKENTTNIGNEEYYRLKSLAEGKVELSIDEGYTFIVKYGIGFLPTILDIEAEIINHSQHCYDKMIKAQGELEIVNSNLTKCKSLCKSLNTRYNYKVEAIGIKHERAEKQLSKAKLINIALAFISSILAVVLWLTM